MIQTWALVGICILCNWKELKCPIQACAWKVNTLSTLLYALDWSCFTYWHFNLGFKGILSFVACRFLNWVPESRFVKEADINMPEGVTQCTILPHFDWNLAKISNAEQHSNFIITLQKIKIYLSPNLFKSISLLLLRHVFQFYIIKSLGLVVMYVYRSHPNMQHVFVILSCYCFHSLYCNHFL